MKSRVDMANIAAIILAAGKGKRMGARNRNKVMLHLVNKPIISHIVDFMQSLEIETIVVVVGHKKKSVIEKLQEYNVVFVEQKKLLGTGHAVLTALKELPSHISDVLVVYGDDAVLYSKNQLHIINKLFAAHFTEHAQVTFLTIQQDNSQGLGRVMRGKDGKVIAIVEERDATDKQKGITEINPGCFLFTVSFLKKYLPKVKKSEATQEYYLTSLIDLAIKNNETIEAVRGGALLWRGVNTPEELTQAEKLLSGTYNL